VVAVVVMIDRWMRMNVDLRTDMNLLHCYLYFCLFRDFRKPSCRFYGSCIEMWSEVVSPNPSSLLACRIRMEALDHGRSFFTLHSPFSSYLHFFIELCRLNFEFQQDYRAAGHPTVLGCLSFCRLMAWAIVPHLLLCFSVTYSTQNHLRITLHHRK
jgi:hypothetical protein